MKRNTLGMLLASFALATTAGCSAPGPMDTSPPKMAPPVVSPPDQPAAMKTLAVTPVGNGGGTVVSDPPGIQCPGTCAAQSSSNSGATVAPVGLFGLQITITSQSATAVASSA